MNNQEWKNYNVPVGSVCDHCKEALTDDERERNHIENEAQDGNAVLCDQHAEQAD